MKPSDALTLSVFFATLSAITPVMAETKKYQPKDKPWHQNQDQTRNQIRGGAPHPHNQVVRAGTASQPLSVQTNQVPRDNSTPSRMAANEYVHREPDYEAEQQPDTVAQILMDQDFAADAAPGQDNAPVPQTELGAVDPDYPQGPLSQEANSHNADFQRDEPEDKDAQEWDRDVAAEDAADRSPQNPHDDKPAYHERAVEAQPQTTTGPAASHNRQNSQHGSFIGQEQIDVSGTVLETTENPEISPKIFEEAIDPIAALIQQEQASSPPRTINQYDAHPVGLNADATPGQIMPAGQDQSAYAKARGFVADRSYFEAIENFEHFFNAFPNSLLGPNAAYWLGESYEATDQLPKAANAYGKAYSLSKTLLKETKNKDQHHVISTKVPASLRKLAALLKRLGHPDQASVTLQCLEREYPASTHPSHHG